MEHVWRALMFPYKEKLRHFRTKKKRKKHSIRLPSLNLVYTLRDSGQSRGTIHHESSRKDWNLALSSPREFVITRSGGS